MNADATSRAATTDDPAGQGDGPRAATAAIGEAAAAMALAARPAAAGAAPRAIEVRGLRKVYQVFRRGATLSETLRSLIRRRMEPVEALAGIDFSIGEGELVAFLGPNGAGKSTTLKILSGILHPTAGEATVLGRFIPWKDRISYVRHIGAVFGQKSQLVWDIPPADAFRMQAAIHGVPREVFRARLDRLVAMLDIARIMRQPTRSLSLGERMRCEFAMALLHAPRILFLDEPTIGLDIVAKESIRGFIREINAEGTTVLLTTHDLQDVERLCQRAIMVDHGRIAFDGSLDELRTRFGERRRIRLSADNPPRPEELAGCAAGRWLSDREAEYEIDLAATSLHAFLEELARRCRIEDLSIASPPLEDAVLRLYASSRG